MKKQPITFRIEQLALKLNPYAHEAALAFLAECGISDWVEDEVTARGVVQGQPGENTATLRFHYNAFAGKELEILQYTEGNNWLQDFDGAIVSHIGMHCQEFELRHWFELMGRYEVPVAQEVFTQSHTNPTIKDARRYHYVIFETRGLIGVDMKFIVRKNIAGALQ